MESSWLALLNPGSGRCDIRPRAIARGELLHLLLSLDSSVALVVDSVQVQKGILCGHLGDVRIGETKLALQVEPAIWKLWLARPRAGSSISSCWQGTDQ
jgi:hypothetical protein